MSRSVRYIFFKLKIRRIIFGIGYTNAHSNRKKSRWEGCLEIDINFEIDVDQIQLVKLAELWDLKKYTCTKLLKSKLKYRN